MRVRCLGAIALVMMLVALGQTGAWAGMKLIECCYFPDKPFPEFMEGWEEGWSFKDADGKRVQYARPDMPLGGYAFVYFQNTGTEPVKVNDLAVEGIKLSQAFGRAEAMIGERYAFSILLSKLPKQQIARLKTAGWPVWFRPEPLSVQPGEYGSVILRLRRDPKVEKINFGVLADKVAMKASVVVKRRQARFESITFDPELNTVYLYARHPKKPGVKLTRVTMDGRDVTAMCEIAADKSLDLVPIVLKLPEPLKWMSYHFFQASYADGVTATSGMLAWGRDIVYGMWGAQVIGDDSEKVAKAFLTDWAQHNINAHMGMCSGIGYDFFASKPGWEFSESLGIGRMITWPDKSQKPVFFFLQDEPDAHDAAITDLPEMERLGAMGQDLVTWGDKLRVRDPNTPILVNLDGTYKPENWYMYGQLADIPAADPYYQIRIMSESMVTPGQMAFKLKPMCVYGTGTILQSSSAPKPMHLLLFTVRANSPNGPLARFPSPEDKRIEVFYALASGAKGLSYWWFSQDGNCLGTGADDPDARKLWREIGLIGSQVRTVGPLITTSTPISLQSKADPRLWIRSLARGTDTIVVLVLNNDFICDRIGTAVMPVERADVAVSLPSWLSPKSVFEVTDEGTQDVAWRAAGTRVSMALGKLDLTRTIVITRDEKLRGELQALYEAKFAAKVKALKL